MTESLSALVKASIDIWAERLRSHSPLVHAAEQGELGPRSLALYLESLRYVFAQSHANIVAAAERAQALQLPELAAYFRGKAAEEIGHDRWAENDLRHLPSVAVEGLQPAAASVALVSLQKALIEKHPTCFLAYTVWAEYLTASLGDEWLRMLGRSGYERSTVSAVALHLEADQGHACEGFEALDRLGPSNAFVQGAPSALEILDGVEQAEQFFEAFCAEICDASRATRVGDVRLSLPT
jgi:hypothetical protein